MTRVWTITELIKWTTAYLAEKGLEDPRLNAELLLAGVLGLQRLDLYLQFDRPVQAEELARFKARLLRRAKREPMQYIDGEAVFRELRLLVDKRVLIPRPETEVLVGEVLAWSRGRVGLRALDIGTGSGAIAISLAKEGSYEKVVASDLSADAIDVARENARVAGTDIEFRLGSGFSAVTGQIFEVIVSNPPYVAEAERGSLQPEVGDWEPPLALFGGPTGIEVIEELVAGAPSHLRAGGLLALEIGADQADRVGEIIASAGRFGTPRIRKDLTGRDRIVLAELE
ncbi:MAG TPA: peptide chain release factor N(5)-glutamine methyltransferase [Longimicrobiaceae bacterium]|nr:peptide chain release factor N(5)-glutamine methyltransferase [Longimicrobiaceae bacterium]